MLARLYPLTARRKRTFRAKWFRGRVCAGAPNVVRLTIHSAVAALTLQERRRAGQTRLWQPHRGLLVVGAEPSRTVLRARIGGMTAFHYPPPPRYTFFCPLSFDILHLVSFLLYTSRVCVRQKLNRRNHIGWGGCTHDSARHQPFAINLASQQWLAMTGIDLTGNRRPRLSFTTVDDTTVRGSIAVLHPCITAARRSTLSMDSFNIAGSQKKTSHLAAVTILSYYSPGTAREPNLRTHAQTTPRRTQFKMYIYIYIFRRKTTLILRHFSV